MFKIFREINKSSDKSLRSKGTARLVSGFTLIEIMVSISIFSVVMLIVIGALLMLNDANKKAQAIRAVVDNLNFAVDDMTRSMRTGRDFKCGMYVNNGYIAGSPTPCTKTGTETIVFTGLQQQGYESGEILHTCYAYSYSRGDTEGRGSILYGTKLISAGDPCSGATIQVSTFVSPEVEIAGLKFYVFDEDSTLNPKQQPKVVIALSGDINVDRYKFQTPFNIQTTVSQRGSTF